MKCELGIPVGLPYLWAFRVAFLRPPPLSATPPRTSSSMPEGGPELEDSVRGTDERPFPPDLAHPAQQKLAEAAPLLDLPKDRLQDGLAPNIQTPTGFGPEGAPHAVRHRQARRRATAGRGGHGPSMELAIRWDERGTAQRREGRDVRLAEITGLQARGSGYLLRMDQHLRQQRLDLLLVMRLIRDVDGGVRLTERDARRQLTNRLAAGLADRRDPDKVSTRCATCCANASSAWRVGMRTAPTRLNWPTIPGTSWRWGATGEAVASQPMRSRVENAVSPRVLYGRGRRSSHYTGPGSRAEPRASRSIGTRPMIPPTGNRHWRSSRGTTTRGATCRWWRR